MAGTKVGQGVRVGPLDPETTADFGSISAQNNARTLIRMHAAAHPVEFRQAHGKRLNVPRTRALRLDEVRDAVKGDLPKGAVLNGAQVRGQEDEPDGLVLTFTYKLPGKSGELRDGRTVKGWAPLSEVELPASRELGDRLAQLAEMREMGIPVGGGGDEVTRGGANQSQLQRQLAELREENARLSQALQERDSARVSAEDARDTGGMDDGVDHGEPFEGYDDLNADDIVERLRESDQDTRDRVAEYEAANKDRKSVMNAAHRTDLSES